MSHRAHAAACRAISIVLTAWSALEASRVHAAPAINLTPRIDAIELLKAGQTSYILLHCYDTVCGHRYSVQYTDRPLPAPNSAWLRLSTVVANGEDGCAGHIIFHDPTVNRRARYYRLVVDP